MNLFDKLAHRLIHQAILKDEFLYIKAKTLLIILLFFLFVLLCYSSLFLFDNFQINVKTITNFLGFIAVLASLLLLKKTKSIKNSIRMMNYTGVILVTGGVYYSGGFASNDILWYVPVALASLLYAGIIDGLIVTIFSILGITFFYLIEIFEWVEFPYDPLTRSVHYRYINAIIIVFVLFFMVWMLVKQNKRIQSIIENIQRLQVRESISQDFHDELGNKLASIVHVSKRLQAVSNHNEKEEMLAMIERETKLVYENFRDFIWANDSKNLTLDMLFMYLNDFNQNFFSFKPIQVEGRLLNQESSLDKILPSKVVKHLIPIFKELMTNIYKHANAKRIDWSIESTMQSLSLIVEDDGAEFEWDALAGGQGLKNINKRIVELQANFEKSILNPKGTCIRIEVEFNNIEA